MTSTDTRTIIVAFIAALFASVISPLIISYNTRLDKEQDYVRQDRVAETLRVENEKRTKQTTEVADKLDTIHALVNSNLTAALQSEHDARAAELVTLVELVDLKRTQGKPPSKVAMARIAATDAKVKELRLILDDRIKQQAAIDAKKK